MVQMMQTSTSKCMRELLQNSGERHHHVGLSYADSLGRDCLLFAVGGDRCRDSKHRLWLHVGLLSQCPRISQHMLPPTPSALQCSR